MPGWSARSPSTPTTWTTTTRTATGEVNFADRGLQLSRGFRALKVWMSVHTFGLAAFRAAIQRSLELAEFAERLVCGRPELTLMAPATLGIVCFRREWPGCDEAETERRGLALAAALERSGTALVSSTRLAGRHAIRLCILNPTSSEEDVRRVIEHFAGAPARRPPSQAVADPAPVSGRASVAVPAPTSCAPCRCWPGCLPPPSRPSGPGPSAWTPPRAKRSSAGGTRTGPSTSSWPGGSTCSSTAGRIRTIGPGDHFGELAARDWGGGYGYTRLATVSVCRARPAAEAQQRGLRVADRHRAPAARAELARVLAERLQER